MNVLRATRFAVGNAVLLSITAQTTAATRGANTLVSCMLIECGELRARQGREVCGMENTDSRS